MASFPRHNCKKFKYYDDHQVKTRYVDTMIEIEVVLIFVAMVNPINL